MYCTFNFNSAHYFNEITIKNMQNHIVFKIQVPRHLFSMHIPCNVTEDQVIVSSPVESLISSSELTSEQPIRDRL